jgi:hypothetical protein
MLQLRLFASVDHHSNSHSVCLSLGRHLGLNLKKYFHPRGAEDLLVAHRPAIVIVGGVQSVADGPNVSHFLRVFGEL